MKKYNPRPLAAGGILLMIGAALWRHLGTDVFYQLNNYSFTPKFMTFDYPDPAYPIFKAFSQLLPIFAKDYLAPVILLLLPGIILLSLFLKGVFEKKDFFDFLNQPHKEKLFLAGIFIFTAAATLIIHFTVLSGYPYVNDELSYLFQGDLIRSGKLFTPSLIHRDHFHYISIINDGRMYSKYTNGWPALLSLGLFLGIPFLVNPILSGGSLVLAYLAEKKLFGPRHGFLSVILMLASPFFLFNGASYWSHMAVGFFTLLTVLALLKSDETPGPWLAVAGFSAGMILNIRPSDGGVLTLSLIPLALYQWHESKNKKKFGLEILTGAAAFFLMAAVLLWCNKIQNGNPFLLGFSKYFPDEKWGFHQGWHTPLKGLWNLAYAFMRSCFWTVPLLTPLLILAVAGGSWKARLLALPVAAYVLFFFGYYSLGLFEFGSRFYFASFVIICLLAPGGLEVLTRRKKENPQMLFNGAIAAFSLSCLIYLGGTAPVLFSRVNRQYLTGTILAKYLDKPLAPGTRTLVFIKNLHGGAPVAAQTRNLLPFSERPNLLAVFLTPEENQAAARAFPDRKPIVLYYDFRINDFAIVPMSEDKASTTDLLAAGINYSQSLLDKEKAGEVLLRALKGDPDNLEVMFNLGYLYFETGKYDKAFPLFQRICTAAPQSDDPLYFAARCAGETGDRKTAREYLSDFIKRFPTSIRHDRARQWLIHYGGKL